MTSSSPDRVPPAPAPIERTPPGDPHPQDDDPASTEAAQAALRVAVVVNVLPHYRSAFFHELFQRSDLNVRVFCQASIPGVTLRLDHERFHDRVTLVPYWGMRRETFG